MSSGPRPYVWHRYAQRLTRAVHCALVGTVVMYVPSFSMPIDVEFWPVQCAPSGKTLLEPEPRPSTERCRPSSVYPTRLMVNCCPESIQPRAQCHRWVLRAIVYAAAWE